MISSNIGRILLFSIFLFSLYASAFSQQKVIKLKGDEVGALVGYKVNSNGTPEGISIVSINTTDHDNSHVDTVLIKNKITARFKKMADDGEFKKSDIDKPIQTMIVFKKDEVMKK